MNESKITALKKAVLILCSIAAVCSAILFIPQVRELIMQFGDRVAHKSINRAIWNSKIIVWELQILLVLLPVILYAMPENKYKPFSKIDAFLQGGIFPWLVTAVSSVVLIALAFQSNDVWLDETFSLGLARHSVKELISMTAQDVHPPLYYLILKAGISFAPDSVILARIVSAIPVIIMLCVSNVFFKKEFSNTHASVFNLILLCTNVVFVYAVEIRMYSWAMLFCLLCCVFSYYIIKNGSFKYFLGYVIFAECGAYCQYWTAVALAINFVMVCILYFAKYKKVKNILIAALIGIVLYLPWASVVIRQVSTVTKGFWVGPITLKTFAGYVFSVIPFSGIAKLLGLFALIAFFIKNVKSCVKKEADAFFPLVCLFTPFLLILFATLFSFITRPVFTAKYAVPTLVFAVFYIAINFRPADLQTKRLLPIFIFGIYFLSVNTISNLKNERQLGAQYNNFTETMEKNLSDNTVFLFSQNVDEHIPYCIAYLYPKNRICNCKISEQWANAIFYNRNNLIQSLENETSICLVLNPDENPPEEFSGCKRYELSIGHYPGCAFYFPSICR